MRNYEKFQALVKTAMEQEAEQKKSARTKSEQHFKAALEQALPQELRDMLELRYTWNDELEFPRATFDLGGPRVATCEITREILSSDHDIGEWVVSMTSGKTLVRSVPGEDFPNKLLLAVGYYWETIS